MSDRPAEWSVKEGGSCEGSQVPETKRSHVSGCTFLVMFGALPVVQDVLHLISAVHVIDSASQSTTEIHELALESYFTLWQQDCGISVFLCIYFVMCPAAQFWAPRPHPVTRKDTQPSPRTWRVTVHPCYDMKEGEKVWTLGGSQASHMEQEPLMRTILKYHYIYIFH